MTFADTDIPGDAPELAFVYDTLRDGVIDVVEGTPDVPASDWESEARSLVALNGEPNSEGTADVVLIRGGKVSLVTITADATRADIRWLEAGGQLELLVEGPQVDRNRVIEIAESLVFTST